MGSEIIIFTIIFGFLFSVFYLFISSRHKERLALIEKGAEASIFYSKDRKATPIWKVIVINISTLAMGIGIGIFVAGILIETGMDPDIAGPGAGFFMAGLGLFTGFYLTKKLNKDA